MNDNKKKLLYLVLIIFALIGIFVFSFYTSDFGAPKSNAEIERFIVPLKSNNQDIISKLKKEGFINSEWALNFALNWEGFQKNILPGAYKISKSMDVWQVSEVLINNPYMKWVIVQEGLRKEEIANILALELGWNDEKREDWIKKDTVSPPEYKEGVYFPDTYLIPVDETGREVAKRFQVKFEEKFAEYSKEALRQNIKWNTVLKMASIIQREAAGKEDMPLISGILWNRLDKNMKLEVDCTLQYARGDSGYGFWAPISTEDKKIDSPYNTYLNRGLPPSPISNPGINAIEAVLNPIKTDCLFYLHDGDGNIHCANDYDGHKKNIEEFL